MKHLNETGLFILSFIPCYLLQYLLISIGLLSNTPIASNLQSVKKGVLSRQIALIALGSLLHELVLQTPTDYPEW